jgi:hypothetical protein
MSSSLNIVMSASATKGMMEACATFGQEVIRELGRLGALNMKESEVLELFDWSTTTITSKRSAAMKKVRAGTKSLVAKRAAKPSATLPFCGNVVESWCYGIKYNHGLHTQCQLGKLVEGDYCKTCMKSSENSASSKPTYGDIRDRLEGNLLDYKDPTGKSTICFANVAAKKGWDVENAQKVATDFGWEIPSNQLEVIKKIAKKKATKKVAKKNDLDDQISKLVAEAADDVLSQSSKTSSISSKKSVKVKVSKKPVKNTAKASAAKAAIALAKKVASDAAKAEKAAIALTKKVASDAAKAEKAAIALAKKVASDAAKAEKAAIALTKKVASDAAKAEKAAIALAKKVASDAAKAEKVAIALAKKVASDAAKAEKLALKEAAKAEKLALKEAAKAEKLALKKSAKAEKLALKKSAKVETDEVVSELTADSIEELQKEISSAVECDSLDDVEDELTLDDSTPTILLDGVKYFRTDAYDLGPNVLFTLDGELTGLYDEETGEIQELDFESE